MSLIFNKYLNSTRTVSLSVPEHAAASVPETPVSVPADPEIHDLGLTLFLTRVSASCYCFNLLLSAVNVNVTGWYVTSFICFCHPVC